MYKNAKLIQYNINTVYTHIIIDVILYSQNI